MIHHFLNLFVESKYKWLYVCIFYVFYNSTSISEYCNMASRKSASMSQSMDMDIDTIIEEQRISPLGQSCNHLYLDSTNKFKKWCITWLVTIMNSQTEMLYNSCSQETHASSTRTSNPAARIRTRVKQVRCRVLRRHSVVSRTAAHSY